MADESDNGVSTEKELEELQSFIDETDSWISQTLSTLGWSQEHILQCQELVQCPVDKGHRVRGDSVDEHVRYCSLLSKGYSRSEIEADQSSKFFYMNCPMTVSVDLDDVTVHNILSTEGVDISTDLPATMTRSVCTLSAAAKRCIYDYCVDVARAASAAPRIADEDLQLLEDKKTDRPLSKLELMAKMRDMKRRRQSYRGKNTHTGKKNYSEVIRDVLSNQMELLSNIWADAEREKQREAHRKHEHKKEKDRSKRSESSSDVHHRRSPFTSDRHHSVSRTDNQQRQAHDDNDDSKSHRSSSRRRKRSRSRSRSRSHKKHKHRKHRHGDSTKKHCSPSSSS